MQKPHIKTPSDLSKDLAGTHKILKPERNRRAPEIEDDFKTLMRDGYVIIENLLSADTVNNIKEQSRRLLSHSGRNNFEGLNTQRVYDVFSKTDVVDPLATHPRVLGLLDRVFMPNYLLSQTQIISIHPDEKAQMLHYDDGFYPMARPRPPLGMAAIWAIDDFTAKNGATAIIPGSQNWGDDRIGKPKEAIPAVMPAGSVIIFLGTLWHGGGNNRSQNERLAVTCQYCEPYLRQQENFMLEIAKGRAAKMTPALQTLLGYSIHPPFMGMINGKHPKRRLE